MWQVISVQQEVSIWGETAKKCDENGEKKLKNHDKKVGAVILFFYGGKSTIHDIIFFSQRSLGIQWVLMGPFIDF